MRAADHRVSIDDVPVVERVTVEAAVSEVEARGLTPDGVDDLEVYRLVMSPVEFKRLKNRLAKLRLEAAPQLPFGVELDPERHKRRLRALVDRPNGEAYPTQWEIISECRLPGRLMLVPGREFTVAGIRGRLRFRHMVRTDTGEVWLDGWDSEGRWRSVRPERVRTVHRKVEDPAPFDAIAGPVTGSEASTKPTLTGH